MPDYTISVDVIAATRAAAQEVASEIGDALQDAADSDELPAGVSWSVGAPQEAALAAPARLGWADPSIDAARAAVGAHAAFLGIEGDEQTQLEHLLVSTLRYCALRGLDFDAILCDARTQHDP